MDGNYSLKHLAERMRSEKNTHSIYIQDCLNKFADRQSDRIRFEIPTIGFCGYGQAGKDESARHYCETAGCIYPDSNSRVALPILATVAEVPEEQAWVERHQHRDFWIAACHELRKPSYTLLIKMCLGLGDVSVGTRGRLELYHAVKEGLFNYTIWIDNNRVPKDHTTEYGPDYCDMVLPNHGSLMQLYARIDKLVKMMRTTYFKE